MSLVSEIQWTDATWNVATGCTKTSPGCAICYIERTPPFRMAGRRFKNGAIPVVLHPERLEHPLRWRKPRRVFVCSLADLFHDDVPDYFIRQAFAVMAASPQHTFQVLTKRPERARDLLGDRNALVLIARQAAATSLRLPVDWPRIGWPLPNVWFGVSIENSRFTWRADVLRQIPAAVRFISAEPLLGSLVYAGIQRACGLCTQGIMDAGNDHLRGRCSCACHRKRPLDLGGIDWLIVGGESGPRARRTDPAWIEELVERARDAGAAPFVKQLGKMLGRELGCSDAKGGDIDEWPEQLRVREFPRSPA